MKAKKKRRTNRVASNDGLCLSVQLYRSRVEGEMWKLRMFTGNDFLVDLPAKDFDDARRLLKMMGYKMTRWYVRSWGADAKILGHNEKLRGAP